jgi:hypothetical protein
MWFSSQHRLSAIVATTGDKPPLHIGKAAGLMSQVNECKRLLTPIILLGKVQSADRSP